MKAYEIRGQYVAKRAFEVAAVGDLRVLLIGPLGSSKTTLREAFPTVDSAERETCLCGHFFDPRKRCICPARTLARWYRRLERTARDYDIVIECSPISTRELMTPPDPHEQELMLQRIALAREFGKTHKSVDLVNDTANSVMEIGIRRLGLTPGQYHAVCNIARAIANIDWSETIQGKHVAESLQYRLDATILERAYVEVCQPGL
jgi:predicted ATPase with chaperone activity